MKYLTDSKLYSLAIESTLDKRKTFNRIYRQTRRDQPSILWISFRKLLFSKKMKKEVLGGNYSFDGSKLAILKLNNKKRNLCQFSYKDFIFLKVLNYAFNDISKDSFCDNLFSYRKGISRLDAINSFSSFLKSHLLKMSDKKYPLFVYKADINQFVEEIPMDEKSLLWGILRQELENVKDLKERELLFKYFKAGARMDFIHPKKFCKNIGTLFGSPISNYIYNIYLRDLDSLFESFEDIFYARYGDDVLMASHDKKDLLSKIKRLKSFIKKYRLKIKKKKEEYILFSGSGFKGDNLFEGKNRFKYLGFDLFFDGTFSLPKEKIRVLLSEIDFRCKNTLNIIKDYPLNKKGKLLAGVINEVSSSFIFRHHYMDFLITQSNSRSALKNIDYLIARRLLKYLTGNSSVKQFRKVSYKKIRDDFGLKSLVDLRNKR
ncbi:MAG: reverse transcriptase domain-containing protein [Candidatus Woesearchaeota archaeon]